MITHDFRCNECGYVDAHFVEVGVDCVRCPECTSSATRVYLKPPNLDWTGMAQGENAGVEFVDRFERIHKTEAAKEEKTMREHGDYGPGKTPPPSTLDS